MLIKDDYNAVINSDNFASHRYNFSFGNLIFTLGCGDRHGGGCGEA